MSFLKSLDMIGCRPLKLQDVEQVCQLYNHYVINSTATFHLSPLTVDQFVETCGLNKKNYLPYVFLQGEVVVGFGYISPFHAREAYDTTVELTLYFHHSFVGKGFGMQALQILENEARGHGKLCSIGCVTAENLLSVNLFLRSGYSQCGKFCKVGSKFGRELDVLYFQKFL